MGSALANLLKFYGHEVCQEFYINDAGSQIQKLGAGSHPPLQYAVQSLYARGCTGYRYGYNCYPAAL